MPEGNHGIDLGRPARRQVASKGCDHHEHHHHPSEGRRVRGAHAEEQTLHYAREGEGAPHAQDETDRSQAESLAHEQPKYVLRLRTECHADTDLLCALGDSMGEQSVYPHGGKKECRDAEETEEQHVETGLGDGIRNKTF